ncbi:glycoside hydrolase family 19 protein [Flavobacterium sp. KMS]|jgi:putative chitinase|uniref:glycoside hydrolase family 19 protein n=1 Tax=Flavobacterium sp. KMS TaxID=1566023 RepID=UPI0006924C0B|nr:glycoside hydrolase family 19 protein [Flavobacterium sp. KMS]
MSFILDNSSIFLNAFVRYGVNTPLRIAHFLAQVSHESGNFTRMVENLNYTPQGLLSTSPFNSRLTLAEAKKYGRTTEHKANQQMIANIGYANKNGNGNIASGDGWRYRGRGFIQLTGKGTYLDYKKYSGHDVVNNPDLLLQTAIAVDCAVWFFAVYKKLNPLADANLMTEITRKVNGKTNGLADRIAKFKFYKTQNINLELLKKKAKPLPNFSSVTSYAWNWLSPFNQKKLI